MRTKIFEKNKQWSVEEREAILDYLHGDTPLDETEACCYYEYARTSRRFRATRLRYNRAYKRAVEILRNAGREDDRATEMALCIVMDKLPIYGHWRREVLVCAGYPKVPWRELKKEQKQDIKLNFVKISPTPVITDARILNAVEVFDHLKRQAEDMARKCKTRFISLGDYAAIAGDREIKHVVVTINYKEGKNAVKKRLSDWLGTEANEKLFEKYYKTPIHKQNPNSPVRYKELLKYLAAWRIHDELGLNAAKEWTKKSRRQHEDASGIVHVRQFFREKQSKRTRGSQLVETPLYGDGREWRAAIREARSFLEEEIDGQAEVREARLLLEKIEGQRRGLT
jgi:hypothetical protein